MFPEETNAYCNIMVNSRRSKYVERRWRTYGKYVLFLVYFCSYVCEVTCEHQSASPNWYQYSTDSPASFSDSATTELTTKIINKKQKLEKSLSPYLARDDIIVERNGHLIIDPGVEIRFSPMVGITVRGILTAKVISVTNFFLHCCTWQL